MRQMSVDATSIAILGGTGHEGRGLAARFAAAGALVSIGSRDAGRATDAAGAISSRLPGARPIRGAVNAAAVADAEIILLAVRFADAGPLVESVRDVFTPGALVIDPASGGANSPVRSQQPGAGWRVTGNHRCPGGAQEDRLEIRRPDGRSQRCPKLPVGNSHRWSVGSTITRTLVVSPT
jgi:NAD(P)-dependent dehydrogenase (short-subunit alcohol dehydrogenase family)